MRGRKPMPTMLKIVTGNAGKRPLNRREPRVRKALQKDPPAWMTETQQAGWRYARENVPPGLLRSLDRSVFSAWVVAEDLHRQASEQVARHGLLIKSPTAGVPIQSPYLPIVNRQALIMMKAAAELGFSPTSRCRIEIDPHEQNEDEGDADGESASYLDA